MTTAKIEKTEPLRSPINWIQLAGIISSVGVFLGFPDIDPVDVSKVILGIQAAASIVTVIVESYRNA
jgi:hypothetical protein